jgi:putative flippase GtrA
MPSLIEQFKGRNHSPLVQFIKYGISGVIATIVHITIFYLIALTVFPSLGPADSLVKLLHLHAADVSEQIRARNAVIGNVTGFMISNFVAYLLNVAWVFEAGRHSRWVELGYFYIVSGISIAIGSVLMGILIDHYKVTTTVAFGVNILVSMLINFIVRKLLIFKK